MGIETVSAAACTSRQRPVTYSPIGQTLAQSAYDTYYKMKPEAQWRSARLAVTTIAKNIQSGERTTADEKSLATLAVKVQDHQMENRDGARMARTIMHSTISAATPGALGQVIGSAVSSLKDQPGLRRCNLRLALSAGFAHLAQEAEATESERAAADLWRTFNSTPRIHKVSANAVGFSIMDAVKDGLHELVPGTLGQVAVNANHAIDKSGKEGRHASRVLLREGFNAIRNSAASSGAEIAIANKGLGYDRWWNWDRRAAGKMGAVMEQLVQTGAFAAQPVVTATGAVPPTTAATVPVPNPATATVAGPSGPPDAVGEQPVT